VPSLLDAVDVILGAGARGITVHPRADERHITARDLEAVASRLAPRRAEVEFNIEGDPRPDLVERVLKLLPHQFTLVPVRPGEVTSGAGWAPAAVTDDLRRAIAGARAAGVRVSLFVEPTRDAVALAADLGADRVELYTEPYARAHERSPADVEASLATYAAAAEAAHARGLGVNAGHDLDLANLPRFLGLPHLLEVSIGHALVSRALFVGLETVVREYLAVVEGRPGP
jgi:pyridoxine 5-phosphate synthase